MMALPHRQARAPVRIPSRTCPFVGLLGLVLLVTIGIADASKSPPPHARERRSNRAKDLVFEAVRQNFAKAHLQKKVELALADGSLDINVKGPGGQTPLMHAVLTGRSRAVKVPLPLFVCPLFIRRYHTHV